MSYSIYSTMAVTIQAYLQYPSTTKTILFCRLPIMSISGLILRTYKNHGFGRSQLYVLCSPRSSMAGQPRRLPRRLNLHLKLQGSLHACGLASDYVHMRIHLYTYTYIYICIYTRYMCIYLYTDTSVALAASILYQV